MAGKLDLKTVGKTLKQFKYPALILLLGLGLILWPSRREASAPEPPQTAAPAVEQSLEAQMEELLSCVEGAGRVRVMLTRDRGAETVYQTDETTSQSGENCSSTRSTVLIRGSGGADAPVARTTVSETFRGAVIVCSGADSAQVRLCLVNAVSSLTGLSSDRITVIKMKQWEDAA